MSKMMGGALASPTSELNKGPATLRSTNNPDMMVPTSNSTHETIPQGMTHKMTMGRKGTREYP
jgi:hypothetical protein